MPNCLNLIRPELSDIKYKIIDFPDGETHIVLEDFDRKLPITIKCRICNSRDLFIMMQLSDIINRLDLWVNTINIYYLMGMRMDRVISINESFSLKIVSNIINSFKASYVYVLEPHSDRTYSLINNSHKLLIEELDISNFTIVFPDAGSILRYKDRNLKDLAIFCSKTRDLKTGKLSGFNLVNPGVLAYSNLSLLVVDDLCDGGGTFAGIAKEIRKVDKNRKLCIYVTHMVNFKGIKTLSENYDEVYFTNSYKDWQEEKLPDNVTVTEVV